MNILLLGPSNVGSTLLQQLLGICMSKKGFGKPIINIPDLTAGVFQLAKNALLNRDVIEVKGGFHSNTTTQTVSEIIEILSSADHYIITRLEEEDVNRMGWSLSDQQMLYNYLGQNFYIIECGRRNLLEYLLSRTYQKTVSRLKSNKYSEQYTIAEETVIRNCNKYKNFKEWCAIYFDPHVYFYYEDVDNIEEFILNLDFMRENNPHGTWKDMFGIGFSEFNTYHNMLKDRKSAIDDSKILYNINVADPYFRLKYNELKGSDWPDIDDIQPDIPQEIINDLSIWEVLGQKSIKVSIAAANFLNNYRSAYLHTINELQSLKGAGLSGYRILQKSQTFYEKRAAVRNFDQVLEWYNAWVKQNKIGEVYTCDKLLALTIREEKVSEDIMQKSNAIGVSDSDTLPLLTLFTGSAASNLK